MTVVGLPCGNAAGWDTGPDVMRCAIPQDGKLYPPEHDMHSNVDGTSGWGNPSTRVRYRCWRGGCLGRSRWFYRVPITDRWGWLWRYEGSCGHWRNR